MYLLESSDNYFEDFLITSTDKFLLQDIALSIFEEDWLEWFNILIDKFYDRNLEAQVRDGYILEEAYEYALKNFEVRLLQLPEPIN